MTALTSHVLKSLTAILVTALFLTGSPSVRAKDEPRPLATGKHPTGLVVEVLAVSVDDTQGKLKVTWRYKNPTEKAIRLVKARGPFVEKDSEDAVYWRAVC